MERYVETELTDKEINDLEEKRVHELNEANIDEKDVIHKARQNLNIWTNYWNENQVRGKDDMNFVLRDQWTAIERSEFSRLFKPAMTFNKLYDAVKKIAGEQRKNKPDLLVRSLTGKATQEQIDLRADLVRTISYQSQNDLVYQSAFKSALMMGFGAFRLDIDYESPKSFNQVIKYNMIPDPTRTAFDPTALKPHKGDGNYCAQNFVFTKEEFFATYPYIHNPISYSDPRTLLDFQWETRDTIVVCDYFVKEWYSQMIYKLSNGMSVTEQEWDEMQARFRIQRELAKSSQIVGSIIENEIPYIKSKRQTQDYKIMHYRMIQDRIIDFSEWPSKQLPIIFVDGDSYYIEGRQYARSFIREARDAQKFINYVGSEIAAEIKNRRREQWIGTPDNIIGNEQIWRNPELQMGILIAKGDPKTGQLPQKMQPWDLSPSLMQNFQRGTQDIKEILGMSESDQLQGKDISGKARRERKLESSMSAYVFFDNLNQAVEQAGRVVLDLLPVIYGNDERHVVISKQDGKTKSLVLNKQLPDGSIENELSVGEYDIEIDTGPSFAVQKSVALEMFAETIQAFPQAFPLIADLWAENLDLSNMPLVKERLSNLVPPEIKAKEDGQPPPPKQPSPEEMQMQMQLQQHQQEMELKSQKMQIEEQAIEERAEELKLRKEKHLLDQLQMILQAKEMETKMGLDKEKNNIALEKLDHDFTSKIAQLVSEMHTQDRQHEHEKSLSKVKNEI